MDNSDLNTEQIILEAAEAEFLEKGYGNAKMMAIAKRAGVSHSMLHYYFRSKENLFQTVFLKKVQTMAPLFEDIFEQHLPFAETVRSLIEIQFNFVKQNPNLPHFLLTEILVNKENRALLFEVVSPKATILFPKLKKILDEEIRKGAIRSVPLRDFIMNIVSINVSTFILLPVLNDFFAQKNENIENFLNERRESNVQFILNALKP